MSSARGPVRSRRVGIDVGGTKAQAVVLDPAGDVVQSTQRPTPRGDHSLDALVDVLIDLADEVGHEGSLGVGVPGLVTRTGVLRAAPNLDGVADFAIAELLSNRFGSAVHVDNVAVGVETQHRSRWVAGRAQIDEFTTPPGCGRNGTEIGQVIRGGGGIQGDFVIR